MFAAAQNQLLLQCWEVPVVTSLKIMMNVQANCLENNIMFWIIHLLAIKGL
jgi:hypothetical protein